MRRALGTLVGAVLLLSSCADAEPSELKAGPDDGPAQAITAWVTAYSGKRCEEFEALIHHDASSKGGGPGSYAKKCRKQSLGDLSPTGMVIGAERTTVAPPPSGTTEEVRVPVQFVIDGHPQVGDFFVVRIGDGWIVYDDPS